MRIAILAALLMSTSSTQAGQLSVAAGDWSNIPLAAKMGQQSFSSYNMAMIDNALIGECKLRDKYSDAELNVPFLIEFAADGSVSQVVVQRLNCPTAESMIGSAVLQLAKQGEYRPTGENQTGWYRGEFSMVSR